jgi:hypothetical protein
MTLAATKLYLSSITLPAALWWFIENVNDEDRYRTEIFFFLRERVRTEGTE